MMLGALGAIIQARYAREATSARAEQMRALEEAQAKKVIAVWGRNSPPILWPDPRGNCPNCGAACGAARCSYCGTNRA